MMKSAATERKAQRIYRQLVEQENERYGRFYMRNVTLAWIIRNTVFAAMVPGDQSIDDEFVMLLRNTSNDIWLLFDLADTFLVGSEII